MPTTNLNATTASGNVNTPRGVADAAHPAAAARAVARRLCGGAQLVGPAGDRHDRSPGAVEPAQADAGHGSRRAAARVPEGHRRSRQPAPGGAAVPDAVGV